MRFNLYTYCGNNPVNWQDPTGLLFGPDWDEYGKWGGLGKSGGETGNEEPIDQMDQLFKQHDESWGRGEYEQGDRQLLEGLKNLPEDPRTWNPPAPNPYVADAFRNIAIMYFEKVIENWDKRKGKK